MKMQYTKEVIDLGDEDDYDYHFCGSYIKDGDSSTNDKSKVTCKACLRNLEKDQK